MRINQSVFFSGLIVLILSQQVQAGPKIQHWTHKQGAEVYFVQAKGLPLLDMRILWDAGSARDGEQWGVAALTSALLDTGAGDWNADDIAKRLEGVGAQMGSGASRDSASLSLRTLTQPRILKTALETVNKIITAPNFNQTDFDRDKQRTLAGLRQREESPGQQASIAYFNGLYGNHPYAHPSSGNIETVEKLTREDLMRFHKQYYVASNAIIVLIGDISRRQAKAITNQVLAGMATGEKPAEQTKVVVKAKGDTIRTVFPSEQTHIYSGVAVIPRGDPDHVPLYVGNHVLGGSGLVSKIFNEVREKRGLAYSASSHFSPLKQLGPFSMSLQTRNDQADEALTVLQQTLADFIKNGPSDAELESARKNITGGFVLRYDSNQKLAEYIAMIAFYGLPMDYLDSFPKQVATVTRKQIKDAFQRRIHPQQFTTVLVGGEASPEK